LKHKNKILTTLCIFLIIFIGFLLRIFSLNSDLTIIPHVRDDKLVAHSNSGSIEEELISLVNNFYDNIDDGNYKDVFQMAVEVSWDKDLYLDKNINIENNIVAGFTDRDTLISKLNKYCGEKGEFVSLFDIKIAYPVKIDEENFSYYSYLRDVNLIQKINVFKEVEEYYLVNVKGQGYLSFCAHYSWEKNVVIIKFFEDRNTYVLLNGAKNSVNRFYVEWLIDRKLN